MQRNKANLKRSYAAQLIGYIVISQFCECSSIIRVLGRIGNIFYFIFMSGKFTQSSSLNRHKNGNKYQVISFSSNAIQQ